MDWLTTPVAFVFSVATAVLFGFLVQRMLGLRLGPIRLLLGGGFALLVYQPILFAIADAVGPDASDGRLGWFVLLAAMCTILAAMLFLVVAEAFVPYGSVPLSNVWGRGLRGRLARTRRAAHILRIVFRNGLWPYASGRRRRALETSTGRAELGRRLTAALNEAGVTFVKIGQILATRRDLVPGELIDELRRLQDDADPVPWDQLGPVLVAELGRPTDEVFAEIDHRPMAAASVGQVHAARLITGESVVVKIRRPGIVTTVERDLDIARWLAGRLRGSVRWGASIGAGELVEGLATALREELDYRVEAANVEAIRRSAAYRQNDHFRIPRVYAASSGSTVLVMERLTGTKLAEAGRLLDHTTPGCAEVARRILGFFVQQVVVDGLFHADPHPGNMMLLENGDIGLLDFGSVGRLDQLLREGIGKLLVGIDRADPLAVSDALLELVPRPEDVDDAALERDLGRFLARFVVGGTAAAAGSAQMFGQLFRIVTSHHLTIPPEVAAVFRMLATIEGTLTELAPAFDLIIESRSIAGNLFTERVGPASLKKTALEELSSLTPILRRLPRRLERIANAAEHGRFTVNVRVLADERGRAALTGLMHQVLVAFLAGVTGIMAVLLLAADGGPEVTPTMGLYQLVGYNLLVVSFILGLRVLAPVFRRGGG